GNNWGGPRWSGVARETDGAEVGLASGVPNRIFGIDKEPIIIAWSECGERMAGGRFGQNGRGHVVGARKVVIEIPGGGRSRIPGHANGVGRFRGHAEVGGRRRLRCGVCAPSSSTS